MMQTDDVNKKRCRPRLHSSGRTHVSTYPQAHRLQVKRWTQNQLDLNAHQHSIITKLTSRRKQKQYICVSLRRFARVSRWDVAELRNGVSISVQKSRNNGNENMMLCVMKSSTEREKELSHIVMSSCIKQRCVSFS